MQAGLRPLLPWIAGGVAFLGLPSIWLMDQASMFGTGCPEITESELVDRAITYLIEHPRFNLRHSTDDERQWIEENFYAYESVSDFRGANPDCCIFSPTGRDGFGPDNITWVDEEISGFVIIDYSIRTRVDDVIRFHDVRGTEIAFSPCGDVINLW